MSNNKIQEMMLQSIDIPSQPEILLEYLQEYQKSDCDIHKISNILQNDIALSASIISTINTPAFNLSHEVTSMQQAIMLMGLENLNNLVYCYSLKNSFENTTPELEQFWEINQNIATIATTLSHTFAMVPPDEVFTATLLSNCGVPPICTMHESYLSHYLTNSFSSSSSLVQLEEKTYMIDHTTAGAHLAEKWDLPTVILNTIKFHHEPPLENESIQSKKERIKVASLVALIQTAEMCYCKINELPTPYEWTSNKAGILKTLQTEEQLLMHFVDTAINV